MTDKETLIQLYEKMGFKRSDDASHCKLAYMYSVTDKTLLISSGDGYRGFHTIFTFDKDDNILEHNVWVYFR